MPRIPKLFFLLAICMAVIGNGCSCQEEAKTMTSHMAIGHHWQWMIKVPYEVEVRDDGTMWLRRFDQEPVQGKWEPRTERIIQFTPYGSSDRSLYIVFSERLLGEGLTFQVCDTEQDAKRLADMLNRLD